MSSIRSARVPARSTALTQAPGRWPCVPAAARRHHCPRGRRRPGRARAPSATRPRRIESVSSNDPSVSYEPVRGLSTQSGQVILSMLMALLPIVRYPDPRLREKSNKVTSLGDDLRKLVADMTETMYAAEGAGLAAIQVGVPLRMFLIDAAVGGRAPTDPPLVFINPEILSVSEEAQTGDEGCL